MDEWHVGDPADWGDSVGVPDIPYMGYLNDDEEDDDCPVSERMSRVERLQRQAMYEMNNNRLHDAFGLISEALSYDSENAESYNIKAIILEEMGQVHAALYNYREALKRTDSPVVKDNKARLLCDVALYYTQPNQ